MSPDDMIGLQEVAEMAHVTRQAVMYWVKQGKLPAPASITDVEGNVVLYQIRRSDAEAFIEARRQDGRYVTRRPRVQA